MLGAPEPPTVDVRFSGPARELLGLTANRAVVDVRIDNVDDSVASYAVRAAQVQVMDGGAGTRVESILEDSVRIVFDLVTERMVPLAPRTIGSAPAGFELAGPLRASPALVRVRGPAMHVRALDSIILPPIDVAALSGPGTLSVAIDTTGMGVIAVMPAAVRVFVPLRLQPSTPDSGDVAIIERGGGR